jgi:membrane-bound lytic murein transglycosylase D
MRFFAPALILFCGVVASQAQTPEVPHKIQFAGMTLIIRDDARKEIQRDVNALTHSQKYFNIKVERARTYFPIIERIFAEERVPLDFKFLVLQESALISDAVSVSDAVGFWQFKDFTAREVGMRVDREVDERMNIVSSTRGAAKYIKQNNYMFNNWLYALQAYQMGAGGLKRLVGDDLDGSRHMEITADTYWYVKKYLAHKVAFEKAVDGEPALKINEHVVTEGGSLSAVAKAIAIEESELREFNKWVKNDMMPADKSYTVVIPSGEKARDFSKLMIASATQPAPTKQERVEGKEMFINGVPVLTANQGETVADLARRADASLNRFLRFNDLVASHKVVAGGLYFIGKKKQAAHEDFHKLKEGENLWDVSQHYGLQIRKLKKYNRLNDGEEVVAGTMLWLNSSKPREALGQQTDDTEQVAELEEDEVFDWGAITSKKKKSGAAVQPKQVQRLSANEYQVMPGETLYGLASRFSTSVSELRSLNALEETAVITTGQVIKVPVTQQVEPLITSEHEADQVHEVKPSETLYSVARYYGVTVETLMQNNNKTDFNVSVGEKLRIPSR